MYTDWIKDKCRHAHNTCSSRTHTNTHRHAQLCVQCLTCSGSHESSMSFLFLPLEGMKERSCFVFFKDEMNNEWSTDGKCEKRENFTLVIFFFFFCWLVCWTSWGKKGVAWQSVHLSWQFLCFQRHTNITMHHQPGADVMLLCIWSSGDCQLAWELYGVGV